MTDYYTPAEAYRDEIRGRWERTRAAVEAFYDRHRHWPGSSTPLTTDPDERRLGSWLVSQRTKARHGRLSEERWAALEAMSQRLGARWDVPDQRRWLANPPSPPPRLSSRPWPHWEHTRALVEAFWVRYGEWPDPDVEDPDERGLGRWLVLQRRYARHGDLPPAHAAALEAMSQRLGTPWRPDYHAEWARTRAAVEEFYTRHGDWPRRRKFQDAAERDLARWLANQRRWVRRGRLDRDRVAALDAMSARLGASWRPDTPPPARRSRPGVPHAVRWERARAAVETYAVEHGRWPHVEDADPDTARLRRWLATQRSAARHGRLHPDRVAALEAMSTRLGADWRRPQQHWWQRRDRIEDFLVTHGRWPRWVSADPAEAGLGSWLAEQRDRARRDALPDDHRQALDALSERLGVAWR